MGRVMIFSSREQFYAPSGICGCGADMKGHPVWDDHAATEVPYPMSGYYKPNPALVEARRGIEGLNESLRRTVLSIRLTGLRWEIERHETSWQKYDERVYAYMKHAEKVLSRLVNFDGGEENGT
jgi:hypothetical protein